MCEEVSNMGEIECDDARSLRKGMYSAWLKKTKSDNARFKMLQSSTTRYFTIDFDSQLFYYAHSEKQKKMSLPIAFRDILGAERLPPATNNKKAKNRSCGFVLKTKDRAFELYANSAADAAKWTFGLNAARDMCKALAMTALHLVNQVESLQASAKNGAVEKPESADLNLAGVDKGEEEDHQQRKQEAEEIAKRAKEEDDRKREQEEAERRKTLELEREGREEAEMRLKELEAKMKAKEAEEAERKGKEEAELREEQLREKEEAKRKELELAEQQLREEEEEASRRAHEEEEREAKRIAQEEEASRKAREEAERLQKEKESQEAKRLAEDTERLQKEKEAQEAKRLAEEQMQEQEEAKRREQEEAAQRSQREEAERIAREQEAEPLMQNASRVLGEDEEVKQKRDDAALQALANPDLQEEDPVDATKGRHPGKEARSDQRDPIEVCDDADMQKKAQVEEQGLRSVEQKNEEEQRVPKGKLQPLQPLKLKPLPKISAPASSEVVLETCNAESDKIKAAQAAPVPQSCLPEPTKEQKTDPDDASGWDSDDGEVSKACGQKIPETCDAKAVAKVPEGPVKFDNAESTPSGWDSEDETEIKKARKAEPTTSSHKLPEGPAQIGQESSCWDDGEGKPHRGDSKAKTMAVPARGAGQEPSGWDDEDKPANVDAKASTQESPTKGEMLLEFDMCAPGPRKAPPKKLTDRLSKKSVSSKTRKRMECPSKAPAAPAMPPPPKHNNGDDAACGAPPKPAQAFVPARHKSDLTPAVPPPSANQDSDLSDLLTGALTADAGLPSRGGSNSHSFVPNLHCTGCDFQVLRIENHVWAKGGDVSYMFLRNNYPNVMKLRTELEAKKGCSAFCCQCSSRSADAEADLSDVSEGLKWRQIQM